jgi:hypothetical protein
MAIGRISGAMLKSNLERQGADLAVETDLLYIDVANNRIGINTSTPTTSLQADNVTINSSQIRSVSGALDIGSTPADVSIGGGSADNVLTTDGNGVLSWQPLSSIGGGALTGNQILLDSPTDSDLVQYGAIGTWTASTHVTDAVDDLNEAIQNVLNNTAVTNVDFTGDTITGGAGLNVTLAISADGNPNRYTIDWGDGTTDTATTDSTPSHVYASNSGSPFSVDVTAFNNAGNGTGSTSSKSRASYITIYTSDPVVSFTAYAAAIGGAPITQWDDGDTIYFENGTTNTSGATVQYTWDWGDGSSDDVVSDSDDGGVFGSRISHTFTASTETDVTRSVSLTLDSHTTALPSAIPTDDSNSFKIYDEHTPTVTLSTTTGINEVSSSGVPVTFTNTTESTIGSYSTYGLQYEWTFGDGSSQIVNVGTGASGDTGNTIAHTYTLSGSDQSSGTPQDYTGTLKVISDHGSSPFTSSNFIVHVEPDVRASISGTANRISDRSGDNQYDVYDGVTYDGVNHALVTVTNTTQNADDYVYNWNDGSANDTPTEDGTSPGSIGATLGHDFTGVSTGNKTLNFTSNGTPDLTAQTDTDSLTFQVNAVPSAPSGLSSFSLTLSDGSQGSTPYLAAGFTDSSASSPLSAGANLNTTTARRYTSGTIDTNIVNNVYNGLSGTLTADINGADRGNRTFTTSLNENGTTTSLVVSGQVDAHNSISASTYPTGFYQTFDAKITQALSSYTVGVNDQRLTHDETGNTNYVAVVYDDLTSTPTCDVSSATLTEASGTYNYISGVPYYNAGATLTLSGVEIYNWIGQTYRNTSNVFQIGSGTNVDGTTDSALSGQTKTYADLENASYLVGGVPTANTGRDSSNKYAIAPQTVTLTSSNVTASENLQIRAYNVNGQGNAVTISKVVKVLTDAPSGVKELDIPVANGLGNGVYTDDGKRITDFLADTTDTPSYTGSTNFYTNAVYTNASDPGVSGTKEASVLYNILKHDTTDHSGVLPVGPDRSSDTGTQYFTFAFRRQVVANFDIDITSSTGIEGMWIAAPGTGIDSASGLNGWLECTSQYAGAGVPGSDTGNGGNGSNGCALTGADVVGSGSLSGGYTMTLGSENMSNATGNVVLVRIALGSGDSVTYLGIGEAS